MPSQANNNDLIEVLNKLNDQIEAIENRLSSLENKLAAVEEKMNNIDFRFAKIIASHEIAEKSSIFYGLGGFRQRKGNGYKDTEIEIWDGPNF